MGEHEGKLQFAFIHLKEDIPMAERFGFAYFKIPGKKSYGFFHRRFSGGEDETRSRKAKATLIRLSR